MKLTVVGCTGSMSGPKSPASSYLVQAEGFDPIEGRTRTWNVVLDMGPGSFGALWNYIDPSDLDAVLFSHCHADHMGDVISMHVHRRWGPARGHRPVLVGGTAGILHRIRQIDGVGEEESYEDCFDIRTFHDGISFEVGPLTITPVKGWHTVPSFGMRIEMMNTDGSVSSMLYTGDTDYCQSMVQGARGVDVLLSECGFTTADEVTGIHMNGHSVGMLATEAGVGRVLVTHIQPWTDHDVVRAELAVTWSGESTLVRSGDVFEF